MKILFRVRDDYKSNIAGDTIQIIKTKEYLEKLGVQVDVSTAVNTNIAGYDMIHIFNLTRIKESYKFATHTISQKKPYVLSTIYWNMIDYIKKDKGELSNYEWWTNQNNKREEMLKNACALLPNSNMEAFVLKKDFKTNAKALVVPNCSDRFFYNANANQFISKYGLKDFVLCVGRISSRKNQLSLINALKGTSLKLVFIGPKSDDSYYNACRSASGDNVIFIDAVKHYELAAAYSAAKVHVLPSWFETPGLSSLEAGLAGCNIVTTSKGSTKEYFKDMAYYCEPSSIESIKSAVLAAANKKKEGKLQKHILENYTWEKAAEKTLEAYEYVLECTIDNR